MSPARSNRARTFPVLPATTSFCVVAAGGSADLVVGVVGERDPRPVGRDHHGVERGVDRPRLHLLAGRRVEAQESTGALREDRRAVEGRDRTRGAPPFVGGAGFDRDHTGLGAEQGDPLVGAATRLRPSRSTVRSTATPRRARATHGAAPGEASATTGTSHDDGRRRCSAVCMSFVHHGARSVRVRSIAFAIAMAELCWSKPSTRYVTPSSTHTSTCPARVGARRSTPSRST